MNPRTQARTRTLTKRFNSALRGGIGAPRKTRVTFGTASRTDFACIVEDPTTGPIQATGPTPQRAIATARCAWIQAQS